MAVRAPKAMAGPVIRRQGPAARRGFPSRGLCCSQRRRHFGSSSGGSAAAADTRTMRFGSASAISDCDITPQNPAMIVEEIMEQLHDQLEGQRPDLLLFFSGSSNRAPLDGGVLARLLREHCVEHWDSTDAGDGAGAHAGPAVILGTSWDCDAAGTGVVGGAPTIDGCEEVQEMPAVTVLGAVLPDVEVLAFTADPDQDSLPTLLHGGSWAQLATLPEAVRFLLKNLDFRLKNPDFRLKKIDFIIF